MPSSRVLTQNHRMRLEVEERDNRVLLRPVGMIDEDFDFPLVRDFLNGLGEGVVQVEFDMGHLTLMNSCGIREWVLMLEKVAPRVSFVFLNLNELFVDQLNMVPGLTGRKSARIESFQAPYYCPDCDVEHAVLLSPEQVALKDGTPHPPAMKCPSCAKPMEFDWIAEEYFAFLSVRAKAA